MHDLLLKEDLVDAEVITDFQLQIEHTVDMQQRERILFIDASITAAEPFEFQRLYPALDDSYTTHAMTPSTLLATYEKVYRETAPPAFLLSIRGYEFDLGKPVSATAADNLAGAHFFIRRLINAYPSVNWDELSVSDALPGSPE